MKVSLLSLSASIFVSCWAQLDRSKIMAHEYTLFQGTPISKLASAAKENDVESFARIFKRDSFNLDFQEPRFGKTLLMLSVLNHQYELCEKLLELGANPNIHDFNDGTSAIISAAGIDTDLRDTTFLKLLLRYGANPNDEEAGPSRKGKIGKTTPILNAAELSIEKVKVLVRAGANINYKNDREFTPLASSLLQERFDIALYLLENGADFKSKLFNRPVKGNPKGKDIFLQDYLREQMLPLNTDEHIIKMKIVDFLFNNGIDYRNVPIPDHVVSKAKELYPETWQTYLKKY